MGQLVSFLSPLEPYVEFAANMILGLHSATGPSWFSTTLLITLLSRLAILPINIYQVKRGMRFGLTAPLLTDLFGLVRKSRLPRLEQNLLFLRLVRKIFKKEKVGLGRFVLSAFAPYPLLVFILLGVRRAAMTAGIRDTPLLWMPNLFTADPYFILPVLSTALTYYNFGLGINPMTIHTFVGRFRIFMQKVTLVWFLLVTQLPGSLQLIILCHALFTTCFIKSSETLPFRARFLSPEFLNVLMYVENTKHMAARRAQINEIFRTEPPSKVDEAEALHNLAQFTSALGKPLSRDKRD